MNQSGCSTNSQVVWPKLVDHHNHHHYGHNHQLHQKQQKQRLFAAELMTGEHVTRCGNCQQLHGKSTESKISVLL
ncbi:MAG: hypothetical protein XXXJIFNMEKO3_02286 [Candidatus Erwinia impunctatus]|nr:hypothetical protein XXXJIFNMEKO_02286 [Culicoides impunctatus]